MALLLKTDIIILYELEPETEIRTFLQHIINGYMHTHTRTYANTHTHTYTSKHINNKTIH